MVVQRGAVGFVVLNLNGLHLEPKVPAELVWRPAHARLCATVPAFTLADVVSEVREDSHSVSSGLVRYVPLTSFTDNSRNGASQRALGLRRASCESGRAAVPAPTFADVSLEAARRDVLSSVHHLRHCLVTVIVGALRRIAR